MKTHYRLFAFLLAICSYSSSASADTFSLNTDTQAPLYQTTLTKEVYQRSHSNDLQDLNIQNATGEPVPYALISYKTLHPQTTNTVKATALNIFPILEDSLKHPSKLRLTLEKTPSKTTIDIRSNDATEEKNHVFLIDAGKKHPPLQKLNVEWQGSEGKLIPVEVLTSNDLKTWSHIGSDVLLNTSTNGNHILQNTITFDRSTQARYLQIKSSTVGATFSLTKVNAEYRQTQTIKPPLLWQDISFLNREEDAGTGEIKLNFESLARYPASHIRIHLPQDNTITSVRILVRDNTNKPWTYLTMASLYKMTEHGKTLSNRDIMVSSKAARYWQLQFNQNSGGLGANNPSLSLGWLPHTIVWNGRGQAPFMLHVGEKPNIINKISISRLIPNYKLEKIRQLPKATLQLGTSANAQDAWETAPDYKRWLLWGGLLIGVLLLARMAFSLLKSTNKTSE